MTDQKKQPIDPDFKGAEKALARAAQRARDVARQTNTAVVYWRDGKTIYEYPQPDGTSIVREAADE